MKNEPVVTDKPKIMFVDFGLKKSSVIIIDDPQKTPTERALERLREHASKLPW